MDWNAAVEKNSEALKRVLAMLVAMAGLGSWGQFTFFPPEGAAASRLAAAEKSKLSPALALPRHLHRAVLRLLRPTEAAARRLIIVMARGLVVALPEARQRKPKPKPKPTILRNGVGTGILMPPRYLQPQPLTPPLKGEGVVNVAPGLATIGVNASESPSPLRGGVRGGGKDQSACHLAFQLLDPLPRWNRRSRPAAGGVPRISVPGFSVPFPVRLPSPDDPVDAARLALRLKALASALDDLPGQARRFARWRARRDAANAQIRQGRDASRARLWPLRPGRPPGGRRKPVHEVDEVLNVVHGLAFWALNSPDTS